MDLIDCCVNILGVLNYSRKEILNVDTMEEIGLSSSPNHHCGTFYIWKNKILQKHTFLRKTVYLSDSIYI